MFGKQVPGRLLLCWCCFSGREVTGPADNRADTRNGGGVNAFPSSLGFLAHIYEIRKCFFLQKDEIREKVRGYLLERRDARSVLVIRCSGGNIYCPSKNMRGFRFPLPPSVDSQTSHFRCSRLWPWDLHFTATQKMIGSKKVAPSCNRKMVPKGIL